jgi:predicted GIY-YIG superfamily endonuclease
MAMIVRESTPDCRSPVLRDKLLVRLREMGDRPDHRRLAAEVLGIRGAPEELARRLVAQALVVEDRREAWREAGERICRAAPPVPGVYVIRDEEGRALYVGKAVNLRRRLRAHFAERRWRATKAGLARAAGADWILVGSELEALLREAALILELQPAVNVQIGPPDLAARDLPRALVQDVLVLVPSVEEDSAELVGARVAGGCLIQRTRRDGADLGVHAARLKTFFAGRDVPRRSLPGRLAPIVFSWLAGRGAGATRLDPHDTSSARALRARLAALLGDAQLFTERLVIYS